MRVYSKLKFNCNGTITNVTVFGQSSSLNNQLELQIWRASDSLLLTPGTSFIDDDAATKVCNRPDSHVLQYSPESPSTKPITNVINFPTSINVRVGNVLGIRHSESLKLLYHSTGDTPQSARRSCVHVSIDEDYYPLISVHIGNKGIFMWYNKVT